jgi:hypothetical protein
MAPEKLIDELKRTGDIYGIFCQLKVRDVLFLPRLLVCNEGIWWYANLNPKHGWIDQVIRLSDSEVEQRLRRHLKDPNVLAERFSRDDLAPRLQAEIKLKLSADPQRYIQLLKERSLYVTVGMTTPSTRPIEYDMKHEDELRSFFEKWLEGKLVGASPLNFRTNNPHRENEMQAALYNASLEDYFCGDFS